MSALRKKRRGWGFIALVVLAIAVAGWYAFSGPGLGSNGTAAIEGATVESGSLRISVVERGNLKAAESVDLACELEGRTTILWLIEEGSAVQPGDLLCQLDTSEFEDRLVEQEISVENAKASYVKAEQNHAIQVSQNLSDIARAERELEFARVDERKYLEGEWPQQQEKAKEDIYLAEQDLKQAEQDYDWSKKLAEKGFLEALKLEEDRLRMEGSKIKLEQTKRSRDLLVEYEYPRRKAELLADKEEAGRELERTNLQAKAKIVDFEADLRSAEAKRDLERDELAKYRDQIEKADIIAPVAGMVVYAREQRGRMGSSEPIQEGTEVRERQKVITIPSANGMVAEASLHETVMEKVTVGMPCVVTVDAVPGRSFPGRIKFKALLPDQTSWWANPDLRVYRTEVEILETDERMRPGMSCSLEILVDEIEDTRYMPLQSVFLDGGEPVCFVSDNGSIEKRSVEVGQNNGRWVEVVSGAEEEETVLLSLPPGFSLTPSPEQEEDVDFEFPAMPMVEAPGTQPDSPAGMPGMGNDPMSPDGAGMSMEERMRAYENMSEEEKQKLREEVRRRMQEGGGMPGAGTEGGGRRDREGTGGGRRGGEGGRPRGDRSGGGRGSGGGGQDSE